MSFSSVPFFITFAENPELAICAEDSIKGARLVLKPFKNNLLALFNVDFVQGLFGLATSGNQLVIGAEDITLGAPLALQLLQPESGKLQRWDIFSAPGNIVSAADSCLAFGYRLRTEPPLQLTELNAPPFPQWIFLPFTTTQRGILESAV
ncbi:hypothetical protein [Chromobacterium violaceum]|uniref:Uncharacterized protein n=1 Tax=Chromobacterium violaceum TaxID=536 RepID=A0A1R0MCD7_CHRVL|nr:hypothetical protein [Chromobacterium violaceum]KJH67408.1 hypothetical protein UF16_10900 [Chromobacterium violaceum]KMN49967.1 hypothetical protein VK93_08150 [Chromobacterium violaceum]KMN87027.1 hypothetical protein VL02_05890 [Chromobacterium violaceum]KMN88795.1 hypothetical protein VL04_18650 [Chromobacterium violaceum]KMO03408.1 hypothetical protein VL16_13540 [Chromobacterium violaceum]